jgi:uncharacterized protein YggE
LSRAGRLIKPAIPVVIAFACLSGLAAQAQQADKFASGFATAMEGVGQSLGDAAFTGQSIFVTATGRAPLPSGQRVWYKANIDVRDASAVEATRQRDARISELEADARRLGVEIHIETTSFALETTPLGRTRTPPGVQAGPIVAAKPSPSGLVGAAPPSSEPPPPAPTFVVKTTLKFAATHPERLAAFLDALRAAGADTLARDPGLGSPLNMFQNNTLLGVGSVEKVDDALWDQASRAAVAAARRQAEVLAVAAGRPLGETREVMVLNRGTQGDDATVTLAVRFAFAPAK